MATKKSRKKTRNNRKLFPALLVVSLLSLIAYFGLGGDDNSEQTKAPSTGAPIATATPVTAAKASEAVTPSPTQAATAGGLFLQLAEPSEVEVFTDTASMTVAGRIRVDAMVTINDTLVEPNIDGEFSVDMALEEGPNIIELVASVAGGEQMNLVLAAIYVP